MNEDQHFITMARVALENTCATKEGMLAVNNFMLHLGLGSPIHPDNAPLLIERGILQAGGGIHDLWRKYGVALAMEVLNDD